MTRGVLHVIVKSWQKIIKPKTGCQPWCFAPPTHTPCFITRLLHLCLHVVPRARLPCDIFFPCLLQNTWRNKNVNIYLLVHRVMSIPRKKIHWTEETVQGAAWDTTGTNSRMSPSVYSNLVHELSLLFTSFHLIAYLRQCWIFLTAWTQTGQVGDWWQDSRGVTGFLDCRCAESALVNILDFNFFALSSNMGGRFKQVFCGNLLEHWFSVNFLRCGKLSRGEMDADFY